MSRIEKKVALSLSSLVKISAMLWRPAMCWMVTVLSATDSRIAFSRMVMCLRPLVVIDLDQHTQALLSLKILMGDDVGRNMSEVSVSWMRFCRQRMALTHSSVA